MKGQSDESTHCIREDAICKIAILPPFMSTMAFSGAVGSAQRLPAVASAPAYAQDDQAVVSLPVVSGKDIRFTALTGEAGLSQSSLTSVVQDDDGFMWFGTQDGLNRYDGYTFAVYKQDRENPNSLGDNTVNALTKDQAGKLWIGTAAGGLDRFDPATQSFRHYRHDPDNPNSLGEDYIDQRRVYADRAGMVWIGAHVSGLDRLNPATGAFTHYRHNPNDPTSLSSDLIVSVYQDAAGMLWIGTRDAGLNQLDPTTGRATHYQHDPGNPRSLGPGSVEAIYEDRSGVLWVGTRGSGLSALDRQTGQFTRYQVDPQTPDSATFSTILAFYEDDADVLWLGAEGAGLLKFDRERKRLVQYKKDPTNPNSLSNNFVTAIYADRSGAMWVTTLGGGVNKFSALPPKFAHYKHEPDTPNSLADNFVLSIFEDHTGVLWIGNDRILNRFDRKTGEFTFYRNDPNDPHSISNGSVTATVEEPDGILWFGAFLGGLNRFDPTSGQFKAYRHDPQDPASLIDDIIRSLYIDSAGTLWAGAWEKGLDRFDRTTEQFQHYQHDPNDPHSLGGNSINDIYEDRAGDLWIATEGGGLNKFDRATERFQRYQNDPQNPRSIASNAVRVIHEDTAGRLWAGTTGGLCLFARASGTCTVYTEKNGLPNNTIEGILEDDQGKLWISTNNGLSRFDPQSGAFRNYDVSDGLQSNEFTLFTAFYKSPRTGEMFFGGINGFNAFFPNKISDNPYVPPVVLTDLRLFNTSVPVGGDSPLQQSIWNTAALELTYDQNSLSFEFAALSYVVPQKNRYRYQLEGFDKAWNQVDSNHRFATYTNLEPGTYLFRVQGSNEDGVWNEVGTSIKTTISPPWWETWWFRSTALTLGLGLAFTGYRLRIRSIEQRSQQLERQVAERTRDLQIAADVSKQITTVLNIDQLLQQVVILTIKGFNLYGAFVLLLDRDSRRLFTAAGADTAGQMLKGADFPTIPLEAEPSIIALAARTRQAVTINDVSHSSVHLPHHRLPETRSELAIPMLLGDRLLGIFDLQSEQVNRFGREDLRVLTTLAEQIAIAVRNAQLFAEAQAAQRTAEAANVAKSTFLTSMSHELRTPLNGILGYAQILKQRQLDHDTTNGLNVIQQSGEHLLTLINDILDLAKIEAGRLELNPAAMNLPVFLDGIVGIIRARAEAKQLKLVFEAPANLPLWVQADETRLRQILLNLLGNAVKFTDRGKVTLRVTITNHRLPTTEDRGLKIEDSNVSADDTLSSILNPLSSTKLPVIRFEVADTGPGIAPDQLGHIFQPFEQVGDMARRAEGSGLGLAISRQLVQLMGGELHVESEPGRGSTFWFRVALPLAEAAIGAAPSQNRVITGYTGRRRTVLVVDDNPSNRAVLVGLLKPLGFALLEAADGQEAIRVAQAARPDLILMDRHMPGMSGLEAAQQIRRIPALQGMPLISVSASVSEADQALSREAGHDAFLPKPISWPQLAAQLEEYLMLEWQYTDAGDTTLARESTSEALIPPPGEELAILYDLARRGDLRGIRQWAVRLEQQDASFGPFARRLHDLAERFEGRAILALVNHYREQSDGSDRLEHS